LIRDMVAADVPLLLSLNNAHPVELSSHGAARFEIGFAVSAERQK